MGTEIIVISIFQLWVFTYSVVVRLLRFIAVKTGLIEPEMKVVYTVHAVIVFFIALLPSLLFLWAISDDYSFALGYIVVIQIPIILVTLVILMPLKKWKNLTSLASIAHAKKRMGWTR